ncbi:hypothetical protein L228DRAFT_266268 [Xylona heveae TC161]|uniref:Rhodopsin domain-containing protein n=1 Tax=Xylona heveae (strain CBS 132557 / TC161) TaxID=1328760 RepID=A0A165J706_XYLHT|nr:hypothetical protein L228DRAFT_266268 [Xylona heveae TC161]KZF25824.1 hypothetical protein L228DRAFT_266268 [Xylona heveae TC161]
MIPKDIQDAIAAGRVPNDISPQYLAESRDRPAIIAMLTIGVFVVLLVSLRCYARLILTKRFGLDDVLIVLALVFYVILIILAILLLADGSGRHFDYIHYVLSNSIVNRTQVEDFAAHLVYTLALYFGRMSGLAFYHRLASMNILLQRFVYVAGAFMSLALLPQIFLLIFHCSPVTGLWPYEWQEEYKKYKCLHWGTIYLVNSVISLICDLLMFIIPSMIIKMLQIRWKEKLKLSCILFPGVLVIIISCVRLDFVIQGGFLVDMSWAYSPMLAVETSEVAGTITALSVPALKPLFGSFFHFATSRSKSATTGWSRQEVEHSGAPNTFDGRYHRTTSISGQGRTTNDNESDDILLGPDDMQLRQMEKQPGPKSIRVQTSVNISGRDGQSY